MPPRFPRYDVRTNSCLHHEKKIGKIPKMPSKNLEKYPLRKDQHSNLAYQTPRTFLCPLSAYSPPIHQKTITFYITKDYDGRQTLYRYMQLRPLYLEITPQSDWRRVLQLEDRRMHWSSRAAQGVQTATGQFHCLLVCVGEGLCQLQSLLGVDGRHLRSRYQGIILVLRQMQKDSYISSRIRRCRYRR